MSSSHIVECGMTPAECARMNTGFDEHTQEHGNPVESAARHGFVALNGEKFLGGFSGLAARNWLFLTDLFVQKSHRGRGIGTEMLRHMEKRAAALESRTVWAWAIGDEAEWFSHRQGYTACCPLDTDRTQPIRPPQDASV